MGLLINTSLRKQTQYDGYTARRAAITYEVPYITTMSAAEAAVDAISALGSPAREVRSIRERTAHLVGKLLAYNGSCLNSSPD